jgi:hypothetical protein
VKPVNFEQPEHEHEFEAQPGLPEPLPVGEQLLWQGSPDWRAMARHVFHIRGLTLYFGAILALRAGFVLADGAGIVAAGVAVLWLLPLVALALGLALLMAWLTSSLTVYTITDKRVVMRIGIVLSLTLNLPLKRIAAAGLHLHPNGRGDIPLTLAGNDKIAFVHLWPHSRPWRLAKPEPMLRCLADAERVAGLLADAWARATGAAVAPRASATAPAAAVTSSGRPQRSAAEPRLAAH